MSVCHRASAIAGRVASGSTARSCCGSGLVCRARAAGVSGVEVLVDPGATAAPLPVVAASCAQPSALGGDAQGEPADLRSLEWDEAGGAGERRDDEAVQVVQDRPGDQFGEVGVFGGLAVALLGLAPQLVVPVGASVAIAS
jgi:hypothetical protein